MWKWYFNSVSRSIGIFVNLKWTVEDPKELNFNPNEGSGLGLQDWAICRRGNGIKEKLSSSLWKVYKIQECLFALPEKTLSPKDRGDQRSEIHGINFEELQKYRS